MNSTKSTPIQQFLIDELNKNLKKSNSKNNELQEQIKKVLSKSKHQSVEAAVIDMKERSGFTNFISKTANTDENNIFDKSIPVEEVFVPIVIKKCPHIKRTVENIINTSKGNLSLPAIIEKLISIHKKDINEAKDWEDSNLLKYLSKENLKEKQKYFNDINYNNLGRSDFSNNTIDPSNTDAFLGLTPMKQ